MDPNPNNIAQSNNPVSMNSGVEAEVELLARRVRDAKIPPALEERCQRMIIRLKRMTKLGGYSSEYELINKYIDWVTQVPWGKMTHDNLDLTSAKQVLDSNHYGMNEVKDRILDYLAVMKLRQDQYNRSLQIQKNQEVQVANAEKSFVSQAPVFCFVGLQGIGKSTMAHSIADALGRKFVRISLGALGTVTQLRGESRASLDAEPGQIIKALVRTQSMNPVISLDEIDKVSGQDSLLKDAMAALLEILDPEQNDNFVDHYLDYPVDLSNVLFVCTANNLGTLSAALQDRLEIIRFTSYSDEEKIQIAKNYTLPKVYKLTSLTPQQLVFEDNVWPQIVRPLGFDAGIRQLERNIMSIARHAARDIVDNKIPQVVITLENVKKYMPEGIGTLS